MAQPPRPDPEWITLRQQHKMECDAFARNFKAGEQDICGRFDAAQAELKRQYEAEMQEYHRRNRVANTDLLGRHLQQEGEYWFRRNQGVRSPPNPTPFIPQPNAPSVQSTPSKPTSTTVCTPKKGSMPIPDPKREESLFKAYDDQRKNSRPAPTAPATPLKAGSQSEPLSAAPQIQRQTVKQAPTISTGSPQPPKPGQPKPTVAHSQPKPNPKKQPEIIDLCSSDDDVLVEVTKAAYKKATPAAEPAPYRPGIPTATLQLFGSTSQTQSSLPRSVQIKQEQPSVAQPAQVRPQSCLPALSRSTANKPPISFSSGQPDHNSPSNGSAAFDSSSLRDPQRASTAQPIYGQTQAQPSGSMPHSLNKINIISQNVSRQQLQDSGNLTINRAALTTGQEFIALQQQVQNDNFGSTKRCASDASSTFVRRDSNNDVDMEDVPLALLNVKAVLKKLGKDGYIGNRMGVDPSSADIAERPTFNKNTQKTHLPSPSPSLPATSTSSEAASLLNAFKKPVLPAARKDTPGMQARTATSRASSCTLGVDPASDKLPQAERQASVLSHASNASTMSRKRKTVDLSDDEQSDYAPSVGSSGAGRRESSFSLGAPIKKPKAAAPALAKRKNPPPPSASPLSPSGKKTNSSGFRTNTTPASSTTSTTAPRTPKAKTKPATPVTPTQGATYRRAKALATPPSKRKAAANVPSRIQAIYEADKQFHTEEEILRASAKETSKGDSSTAELGTRLRSMSITPVPMGTSFDTTNDRKTPSASRRTNTSVARTSTKDKGSGCRATTRSRNINSIIGDDSDDDDSDDLDTSDLIYVNGIIIQKGQEGRLSEMQTRVAAIESDTDQ